METPEFVAGYAVPLKEPWENVFRRCTHPTRSMVLEIAVRLSLLVPGNIVEFGVASGDSTRAIRRTLRRFGSPLFVPYGRKRVFAFDSFEGLREPFNNAPVGTFACEMPKISGVRFVKGYFEETCSDALRAEIGSVAFAHLDADLYSSTKFALSWLTPLLHTGSLLLFDEFTGHHLSEGRAFGEWLGKSGLTVVRLAEFDRDPSAFGTERDRRLLYQVIGTELLLPRVDKSRMMWKVSYYLRRLGFDDLRAYIDSRFS